MSESTSPTPKKRRRSSGVGKQGWQARFIKALSECPNVSVACDVAHIDRHTAYDERDRNPAFAADWETAAKAGVEALEAECWRRARIGTKRGVWMKGPEGNPIKVEDITDYSDTLAIFLLKAHNPAKYRETVRQEVKLDGVKIEVEQKSKAEFDYDGFAKTYRAVFGFPEGNGVGESVHSPHTNGETSDVPGSNGH